MSDRIADPPRQNAFSGGSGGVGLKKALLKMQLSRFQCDFKAHCHPYISKIGGYVGVSHLDISPLVCSKYAL